MAHIEHLQHGQPRALSRLLPSIVLMVVASGSTPAMGQISFKEFTAINKGNRDQIASGRLTTVQVEYENYPSEELQKNAEKERLRLEAYKAEVARMPGLSEKMRQANIAAQERTMRYLKMQQAGETSRTKASTIECIFDVRETKYLLDVRPNAPAAEANKTDFYKALLSEGSELRYMYQVNNGVIQHSNGPGGADRRFSMYLGTVRPDILDDPRLAASSQAERLDGRDLVLFRLGRVSAGQQTEIKLYVDPAMGYRYRRVEFIVGGQVGRILEAAEYKVFNGLPLPTVHKETVFYPEYPNTIKESVTTTIKDAQFNQAIDPETFKIAFTPKTRMLDARVGLSFKLFDGRAMNDSAVKLSLEDVVSRSLAAQGWKVSTANPAPQTQAAAANDHPTNAPAAVAVAPPLKARTGYLVGGGCLLLLIGAIWRYRFRQRGRNGVSQ